MTRSTWVRSPRKGQLETEDPESYLIVKMVFPDIYIVDLVPFSDQHCEHLHIIQSVCAHAPTLAPRLVIASCGSYPFVTM